MHAGDGICSGCGMIGAGLDAVGDLYPCNDLWQLVLAIKLAP